MDFGRRQAHFIGEVIAGRGNAAQDLAHFRLVVDEPQQGLAARAGAADAENVLGRRVQVDDKKVFVQQDDAGTQAVDDLTGIAAQRPVAGPATSQRTVACCT
jgi:hypothetical protein